ncbi:MAG: MOSC domain-containing protein [Candidatus Cybelea sp.]
MLLGTLDAVRRYPVKSLPGERLEVAEVAADGIPGDRARALFVLSGSARLEKIYRGKEDERLHRVSGVDAARAAAAQRGVELEVRSDGHFFDDAPISIVADRWLDELSKHVGYHVEWERFRPNFFVRACDAFAKTESELVDASLALGSVKLRVRCPIGRCVAVTYHPHADLIDPRILEFIAQERNAWMGIYCDVLVPGAARVGDALTLL